MFSPFLPHFVSGEKLKKMIVLTILLAWALSGIISLFLYVKHIQFFYKYNDRFNFQRWEKVESDIHTCIAAGILGFWAAFKFCKLYIRAKHTLKHTYISKNLLGKQRFRLYINNKDITKVGIVDEYYMYIVSEFYKMLYDAYLNAEHKDNQTYKEMVKDISDPVADFIKGNSNEWISLKEYLNNDYKRKNIH